MLARIFGTSTKDTVTSSDSKLEKPEENDATPNSNPTISMLKDELLSHELNLKQKPISFKIATTRNGNRLFMIGKKHSDPNLSYFCPISPIDIYTCIMYVGDKKEIVDLPLYSIFVSENQTLTSDEKSFIENYWKIYDNNLKYKNSILEGEFLELHPLLKGIFNFEPIVLLTKKFETKSKYFDQSCSDTLGSFFVKDLATKSVEIVSFPLFCCLIPDDLIAKAAKLEEEQTEAEMESEEEQKNQN